MRNRTTVRMEGLPAVSARPGALGDEPLRGGPNGDRRIYSADFGATVATLFDT
jgi:hypothetical protein